MANGRHNSTNDLTPAVVAVGISGGALLLGLADLDYHVAMMDREMDLRERWEECAKVMRGALEEAMEHHRELTGQGFMRR